MISFWQLELALFRVFRTLQENVRDILQFNTTDFKKALTKFHGFFVKQESPVQNLNRIWFYYVVNYN